LGDVLAVAHEGAIADATAFGDRPEPRSPTPWMDEALSAIPLAI